MTDKPKENIDDSPEGISHEIERRKHIVNLWRDAGIDPFGLRFERDNYAQRICEKYPSNEGEYFRQDHRKARHGKSCISGSS
jgi:hypothetical protein